MTPTRWMLCLGLLFPVSLVAVTAQQQTQPAKPTVKRSTAHPIDSVAGKDTFAAYCAVCHGTTAKGDGPAAAALKVPPPDLTTLAKRNNGKYDKTAVLATIRGISKPAHGSEDMPIWGPVFQKMSATDGESALRLSNLVEYIGTLQQK